MWYTYDSVINCHCGAVWWAGEIGRGGGGVWWPLEWESRDSRWLFAIFSAWQIQFAEKGKSPAPFPQSLMHRCHLYCVRQVLFHRHSFPWLARRVGQLDYRREPLIMNNQSKLFMGGGRIFISEAFKLITPSTPPSPVHLPSLHHLVTHFVEAIIRF